VKARYRRIYRDRAARYDALVAREDHQGNLLPALLEAATLRGAVVAEMGAGTGRVTALVAPLAKRVCAFDASDAMLRQAARRSLGDHVTLAVADHRALPLADAVVDVVLEAWAFGHLLDEGTGAVVAAVDEAERVVRPDGVVVLIETLGTGRTEPAPPSTALADLYGWLESERGFRRSWIRTDYRFESETEAAELTGFFFGEAHVGSRVVPECTGLWVRRKLATQSKDPDGGFAQEEGSTLVVEVQRLELRGARAGLDHRVVAAEEALAASAPTQKVDEAPGVAPGLVGGGVDVDVGVLRREGDHLVGPGVADVSADDLELGEIQGHAIEVGDGATGIGFAQGSRVADLEAKGHPELDALRVERVVAAIVGRQAPQPG